jgi:hypothetical protein
MKMKDEQFKAICPICKNHCVVGLERMTSVADFRNHKKLGFVEKECMECFEKRIG